MERGYLMIQARFLAVRYLVLYQYTRLIHLIIQADSQSTQVSKGECVIHLRLTKGRNLLNYLHIAIYGISLYTVSSTIFCFVRQSAIN